MNNNPNQKAHLRDRSCCRFCFGREDASLEATLGTLVANTLARNIFRYFVTIYTQKYTINLLIFKHHINEIN